MVKKLARIRIVLTLLFLGAWLSASNPIGIHASEGQSLSLQITPAHAFSGNGYNKATFHYTIRGVERGDWICTGWEYPIYGLQRDTWPLRRSCREVNFRIIEEDWGGWRFPLPYPGEYIGFVEANGLRIERKFLILAGH